MTKKTLLITFILISLNTFGQVKELEKFRAEITLFVNYDNGKIDSLPKSLENSNRLKKNCELAFVAFIKNKDSKNLDNLKKNSKDNKSSYIIGNNNYFFHSLRKDPLVKSFENNVNYNITFYGLYDYKLSNFVSFFIQPIIIGTLEYIIYYYKLNGKGTYYIKDAKSNEIIFQSEGLTSNAPIKKYSIIDKYHILFVEDLGDNGQRAIVVNTKEKKWKAIKGFNGRAFLSGSTDYTKKSEIQNRTYFKFAQSRTIISKYGEGFLKKYEIDFDVKTKTISYKRYSQNESEIKVINSKWKSNIFKIDDYYMGQDIDDKDLPIPMMRE
jgi:hypothetical protein